MRIKIEKLIYGGLGLGRHNGKAIFVPYSAPGDICDVEVVKSNKGFDEGKISGLVEAASSRIEPVCRYYGRCGGCHLQHINYAHQILWKQIILEEQIQRLGGVADPKVEPTIPSATVWGYRCRIQVHKEGERVGFFERESNEIVDVEYCPIAAPDLNEGLESVRKKWPAAEIDRIEISKKGDGTFSQINPSVNEGLKAVLNNFVNIFGGKNLLELYAGSGNFTFGLAKLFKKVVAVELDELAVENACKTMRRLHIKNVEFIAGSSEGFLKTQKDRAFDCVLVDPPREGLGKNVVEGVTKLRPTAIIYVSCDPSTLARDVKSFAKGGYCFVKSQPIDMFPQTYHIESVTLLKYLSESEGADGKRKDAEDKEGN